jgi:GDPmannose 4,6-dehydratase
VPRALITGITGQDGRYLAEFLQSKGYEVFGLVTGQQNPKASDVGEELPFVNLVGGDLQDISSLLRAIKLSEPDEVYNLGAVSFVALSFEQPELTANITGLGVLRLLEAIRVAGGLENGIRFYQASSSEMFGSVRESPQRETTPFYPRSPYGAAKAFGHYITVNYREAYGLFACSGILFNHESPRRGFEFVTRKITNGVARIQLGVQERISLGNLDAHRDWGYAGDYVEAMWLMLQQDRPDDYVVATGVSHSVRDFARLAFEAAGITDWEAHVDVDDRYLRPADVERLVGDATKMREVLGWEPRVAVPELVRMMVEHDLQVEKQRLARAPSPAPARAPEI